MLDMLFQNPITFVYIALSLVIAVTFHEFCHALAADKLGDPTPRLQGRLNLNPLSHLDPFGAVFMVIFGFGWGKPVEYDPYNLRSIRKDGALIAVMGPISNIILALAGSIAMLLFIKFNIIDIATISSSFLSVFIVTNISLAAFNLIPIHPLDGFKIVEGILPKDQAYEWRKLERYGMIFLLVMILPLIGNRRMLDIIMMPIISVLQLVILRLPMLLLGIT